tara:strand:- start:3925 stop:5010 length:1086 start_codon:yes stop_codon:yes gene_type:complete
MSGLMNPRFQWDHVHNPSGEIHVIELAGAPIMECLINDIREYILTGKEIILFLNGEQKQLTDAGEPASNFRSKSSNGLNNHVVKNLIDTIGGLSKDPRVRISLSAYPRKDRYITFLMTEEGKIEVYNKKQDGSSKPGMNRSIDYEKTMSQFLDTMNVSNKDIQKIRETSKSAKYRTYMADILSFLLQVDIVSGGTLSKVKCIHPEVYYSKPVKCSLTRILCCPCFKRKNRYIGKVETPSGDIWEPITGNDYLYLDDTDSSFNGKEMIVPEDNSIDTIYERMWEAMSNEENDVKRSIRSHFNRISNYHGWRDYCVNDTDDAFTILVIINAYSYVDKLSEMEKSILRQFKSIIDPWYKELQRS